MCVKRTLEGLNIGIRKLFRKKSLSIVGDRIWSPGSGRLDGWCSVQYHTVPIIENQELRTLKLPSSTILRPLPLRVQLVG